MEDKKNVGKAWYMVVCYGIVRAPDSLWHGTPSIMSYKNFDIELYIKTYIIGIFYGGTSVNPFCYFEEGGSRACQSIQTWKL